MAGLQQVDTTEVDASIWLLSDIPLLGELFKPSKNETKRRELIIFIRPTPIESSAPENMLDANGFSNPEAKAKIENFLNKGKFYPNGEIEKKAEEFEQNRPINRMLSIPINLAK